MGSLCLVRTCRFWLFPFQVWNCFSDTVSHIYRLEPRMGLAFNTLNVMYMLNTFVSFLEQLILWPNGVMSNQQTKSFRRPKHIKQ